MSAQPRIRMSPAEEGQVIVLLALAALFFIALLAVVADTSLIHIQRRNLQNTADAAALAGAQELDGTEASEGPAIAAAEAWASKNISDLASIETVVLDNYTKIRVTVRKNSGSIFAGAFGISDPLVSARAAARIASLDTQPCVVPFGVQYSFYQEGLEDPDALVSIKLAVNGGPDGTSNTGLLNLTPGNSATPIAYGACNALAPELTTKPGGTIGDVNNGFKDRLRAAIDEDCYVYPATEDDLERCAPPLYSDGSVQASAIVLMPVLDTNIVQSGAQTYPLMLNPDGTYMLAYFWLDGDATYENPAQNKFQCKQKSGEDKCTVFGKWLLNVPIPKELVVFSEDFCPPKPDPCVIEFDPDAPLRIVMMDE